MNEQAIIKIQAVWRGSVIRKYVLYLCPACHSSTLAPSLDGTKHLRVMVCEGCYYGVKDTTETKTPENTHDCGDWMCPGDCGILWCGCIDICRKRHGCHDVGSRW